MEIWKVIEETPKYEISNLGNVKINLKFRKYRDYNSKPLKPHLDKNGYNKVTMTIGLKKYNRFVHRLIAVAFIPNPKNKGCVNHINGIKNDNRTENLEWCTVRENNIHAIKMGLKKPLFGENHNLVKITRKDVEEIKENKDNLYQWQLGLVYGIGQVQVSRIINNKRWIK